MSITTIKGRIQGEFYDDLKHRILYATDASIYEHLPMAVVVPKNENDIKEVISIANKLSAPIIPRAGGTSLAGQCVGNGIVVDISKNFDEILELNTEEMWVRVKPGVNRDILNKKLKTHNLLFGPETSTSAYCKIGGMVGNNASGAHALWYGTTRDKVLEVKGFLSDGSFVTFKELTIEEYKEKLKLNNLEGDIYRNLDNLLNNPEIQQEIFKEFPKKEIYKRNTGYPLDLLIETAPFLGKEKFNMCSLLTGSEGTLMFMTEIKLKLSALPPPETGLLVCSFKTMEDAYRANLIALKYNPSAIELMDRTIIHMAMKNKEQAKNRFFIEDDPVSVLIIELNKENQDEVNDLASKIVKEMRNSQLGYAFRVIFGENIEKVWSLRKAGVGIINNTVGDEKPVCFMEDTAVSPFDLESYMNDINGLMKKNNLSLVYYAHIGSGELHLRPFMNLKTADGQKKLRTVAFEVAKIVKKYRGSLSGEHGDGIVRGEFLKFMVGDKVYNAFDEIKKTWDKNGLFNPNKIVNAPRMDVSLRSQSLKNNDFKTTLSFSKDLGFRRAIEKCNGVGRCRKTADISGGMCPSYMATLDEKDTTRGRANVLRHFINNSQKENPFDHQEIYDVLDLCLSCKACAHECPSNVDMASLKAEFLQQYYEENGVPLNAILVGHLATINRYLSTFPSFFNFFLANSIFSSFMKKVLGFHEKRNFPLLSQMTLKKWFDQNYEKMIQSNDKRNRRVYLFCDEMTNYNDSGIGIKTIILLSKLGYDIQLAQETRESGRTFISKGMLKKAKKVANHNVKKLSKLINQEASLIGVEPSAILSFRDEYPRLVDEDLVEDANRVASSTFLIDEFLAKEMDSGNITQESFHDKHLDIKFHGHCQQKAVSGTVYTKRVLSFPQNYSASEIESTCCGMAGSFGFEKKKYNLSMRIGELKLFPAVRKYAPQALIVAFGTSCRHQIYDGTNVKALHPVEVLYNALSV